MRSRRMVISLNPLPKKRRKHLHVKLLRTAT